MANTDVLVVHVDADIASENALASADLRRECPPATATCDRIRAHVLYLLGCSEPPARTALCIPAQSTETWVLAALYPSEADQYGHIECRQDPAALLVGRRPGLVRRKDGAYKKVTRRYADASGEISSGWTHVTARCPEAGRFEHDMLRALGRASTAAE
jgi:hypothetical protein